MDTTELIPHVFRTQDRLDALALSRGFDAAAVWNHPRNADLRAERAEPTRIEPGDIVWLPALEWRAPLDLGASNQLGGRSLRRVYWVCGHAPEGVPTEDIRVVVLDSNGLRRSSIAFGRGVLVPDGGRAFDIEVADIRGDCFVQLHRGALPLERPVRVAVKAGDETDVTFSPAEIEAAPAGPR